MHRNEETVQTKLQRIEARAKQDVTVRFTSLAHLLEPELLHAVLKRLNKKGAPGVDGITMKEYAQNADTNITILHQELKEQRYRATSVRRTDIPKGNGKLRTLGIPTAKDRVAQKAVSEILTTIYEPYFEDISYGFRPERSCHQALEAVRKMAEKKPVNYIVDVDIKGFFDHVQHEWMVRFLNHRIADTRILRLIVKWLKAGIMDNGVVVRTEEGTPQGGPISPILSNIYLHYVLDLWFEKQYKKRCRGFSGMIRYADDFIVGFEKAEEAEQFLHDLKERFSKFKLEIAEDKTQIITFGRRSAESGKIGPTGRPRTFNFLGFTHYMRCRGIGTQKRYTVARKPKKESRDKFLKNVKKWIKQSMHCSIPWQKQKLSIRLKGYYNYFGLRYCLKALEHVKWHVERIWIKTLRKRSQKHHLWWRHIREKSWFQLPKPQLI